MKFSGIDLHSNNSVVVISEETDRIVYEKRLPNNLEQILAALAPHREELVGVVIESTFNWYWLVDGLMDAGYRVHLAHPSAIKKYEGLKYSGDFADAGIWPSCCGWDCWPRAISIRARSALRATFRASACSWCATARRRFWRSRTSSPGRPVRG